MSNPPLILAIDTSCDDTSAAVTYGWEIWSNIIASQTQLHKPYGGVFPTVAKQAHRENIDRVIEVALKRAGVSLNQIDAIAVTQGPGLAPALEVGIEKAKELALTHNKPLIPVNHIEGHLLSVLAEPRPRKGEQQDERKTTPQEISRPQFPILGIVVSGGHTLFILVRNYGHYEVIGSTIDDAAGECLDKIGRMLNLGYPAGPNIEHFAKLGNERAYDFPLPMTHTHDFNLSFSGLKTFARNLLEAKGGAQSLSRQELYDLCASVQYSVFRHITYKLNKILLEFNAQQATTKQNRSISEVWLGGGVAANTKLRRMIRETLRTHSRTHSAKTAGRMVQSKIRLRSPYSKRLCMDNAAMIGVVGALQLEHFLTKQDNTNRVLTTKEEVLLLERQSRGGHLGHSSNTRT
jgi:N6-L-threonylcarbamoyladenine synthase